MNLYFIVLAALPLGYFVARRSAALIAFLIADCFVFSYQSVGVLLTWLSGAKGLGGGAAFGPAPQGELPLHYSSSELSAYGVVNLVLVLIGIALVLLGAKLRARRAARSGAIEVGRTA